MLFKTDSTIKQWYFRSQNSTFPKLGKFEISNIDITQMFSKSKEQISVSFHFTTFLQVINIPGKFCHVRGSKTVFHHCCDEIIWKRDVFNVYGKGDHCILNALDDNREGSSLWNEGVCKKL